MPGSITTLIKRLSEGDRTAVDSLWSRFWSRLTKKARDSVQAAEISADEEDVAQNVFHDVVHRIEEQRVDQVENRRRLWRMLEVATYHEAVDLRRQQSADMRSGPDQVPLGQARDVAAPGSGPPSVTMSVEDEDDLERISQMVDARAKTIVTMVLHGYSTSEIAERLEITPRTVDRKLVQIRDAWMKLNHADDSEE